MVITYFFAPESESRLTQVVVGEWPQNQGYAEALQNGVILCRFSFCNTKVTNVTYVTS